MVEVASSFRRCWPGRLNCVEESSPVSQGRNVHPLAFRVKSVFSTVIGSLDDAENIWPWYHFCNR